MTSQVRVLCRPASVAGFGLAGLRAVPVPEGASPELALNEILASEDTGILLVEESVYGQMPEDVRARLDRSVHPVAVPFPGPFWEAAEAAEERVVELLRRAIGYRVRLR
jgi:vacuolar-type H+-ATPase subunit F/Vma7